MKLCRKGQLGDPDQKLSPSAILTVVSIATSLLLSVLNVNCFRVCKLCDVTDNVRFVTVENMKMGYST